MLAASIKGRPPARKEYFGRRPEGFNGSNAMNSSSTDECRRLRDRVEELEQERHDAGERRLQEHERRRKDRKEEAEANLRTAHDWPDAFRKQRVLIGPELRMATKQLAETEADTRYTDPADRERDLAFWREDVAGLQADLEGINAAERIYAEESRKAQEEIDAIRRRMLTAVAARLRERGETPSRGFVTELLERLEKDDPAGWLSW